jgi:hypothetical protein
MTTQDEIFSPFFATVFLTLIVWVYMYIRRINFITSRKLKQKDLEIPGTLAQISPPSISNPSDNLKNLFEIPVLFYALDFISFRHKTSGYSVSKRCVGIFCVSCIA